LSWIPASSPTRCTRRRHGPPLLHRQTLNWVGSPNGGGVDEPRRHRASIHPDENSRLDQQQHQPQGRQRRHRHHGHRRGEHTDRNSPSCRHTEDDGFGLELHRSRQIEEERRRLQKAIQPRHLLRSAASSHPTHT
jgi:hypothetical protein